MQKLILLIFFTIGFPIGLVLIAKQHNINTIYINGTVISTNESELAEKVVQLSKSASHSYPVRQLERTLSNKTEFLSLPDDIIFDSTKIKITSPIKGEFQDKKAKIETLKYYITTE